MFSIFTNPKKLVVPVKANPQVVLQEFRKRLKEDTFLTRMSLSLYGGYIGEIDGRNIKARYAWAVHNSWEPTLHLHIENTPEGAVILGRYRTGLFPRIFISFWMSAAVLVSFSLIARDFPHYSAQLVPFYAFPLFGLIILGISRLASRHNERELEKLVDKVARTAEAAQDGIPADIHRISN